MTALEPYILDCTLDPGDGLHCFCPVELDDEGNVVSVVTGLNYLSTDPPEAGRLIGVVHLDGQEMCDQWCAVNEAELTRLFGDRPSS